MKSLCTCIVTSFLAASALSCGYANGQTELPGTQEYFNRPDGVRVVPVGVSFQHGDWELVCDNTRTCRAAGYQSVDVESYSADVSVLLTRKAGPSQAVEARLKLDGLPQHVSIDGHDLGTLSKADADGVVILTQIQTRELLRALTRKSEILVINDRNQETKLSDKGAAAVLLKMDEFQGRLGTPGALIRKGNRDEAGVLKALPILVVHIPELAAPRVGDAKIAEDPALFKALRDEGSCYVSLSITRLTESKLLASALCSERVVHKEVYHGGYAFRVINAKPPYRPQLVTDYASDFGEGQIYVSDGSGWYEQWSWDGQRFIKTGGNYCDIMHRFVWDWPCIVSDVIRDKK